MVSIDVPAGVGAPHLTQLLKNEKTDILGLIKLEPKQCCTLKNPLKHFQWYRWFIKYCYGPAYFRMILFLKPTNKAFTYV